MEIDKTFKNPTPVAVAILPILRTVQYVIRDEPISMNVHSVLYVRRNIQPALGMLALPGGFVNEMERIETSMHREILEETGLDIHENDFKLFRSEITPNNRNLIFCIAPTMTPDILTTLFENLNNSPQMRQETQEFVISGLSISDAAFPLHQKVVSKYLDHVNGNFLHLMPTPIASSTLLTLTQLLKNDGFLSLNFTSL